MLAPKGAWSGRAMDQPSSPPHTEAFYNETPILRNSLIIDTKQGNPVIIKGSQNYDCNASLTKKNFRVHTKSISLIQIFSRSFHDTSISDSSSCNERQNESAATWPGF